MYTDTTRPNHLAQEVIDNSVDESLVEREPRWVHRPRPRWHDSRPGDAEAIGASYNFV